MGFHISLFGGECVHSKLASFGLAIKQGVTYNALVQGTRAKIAVKAVSI